MVLLGDGGGYGLARCGGNLHGHDHRHGLAVTRAGFESPKENVLKSLCVRNFRRRVQDSYFVRFSLGVYYEPDPKQGDAFWVQPWQDEFIHR